MTDSADRPAGASPRPRPSRRGRGVAVVIIAVIVALGGSALVAWMRVGKNPSAPLGASKEGDPVIDLGPNKGARLDEYVKNRGDALAKVRGERVALVSLNRYTTEPEARTTVGNAGVIALLAAAPGGGPSVVAGDLKGWAADQKASAQNERAGFVGMLKDTDDPDSRQHFQAEIQRLSALIDRITPGGAVVFAAVVKGDAVRLRGIAKAPGVRLVDVGTSATVGPKVEYRGIRPEETAKAGDPEFRPL